MSSIRINHKEYFEFSDCCTKYDEQTISTANNILKIFAQRGFQCRPVSYRLGCYENIFEMLPLQDMILPNIFNNIIHDSLNNGNHNDIILRDAIVVINNKESDKYTFFIKIPKLGRRKLFFIDILKEGILYNTDKILPIIFGKDGDGHSIIKSLYEIQNLLIFGDSSSRLDMFISTIISSLICRYNTHELKLVISHCKSTYLSVYDNFPYLLHPICDTFSKLNEILGLIEQEMDERFKRLADISVTNIVSYNKACQEKQNKLPSMPFIVVIINDINYAEANLSCEVQDHLIRLLQLGRACGIHLILTSTELYTEILTKELEENIHAKVFFQIKTEIELQGNFEIYMPQNLIHPRDIIFINNNNNNKDHEKIHTPYLSNEEISMMVRHSFIRQEEDVTDKRDDDICY